MKATGSAALLATIATLFSGCVGGMLNGKMYRVKDGNEFPFQIQTSYGSGKLKAEDPSTGEKFEGQYTGQYQGGGSSSSTVYDSRMQRLGTVDTYTPPTRANARGILKGDKGTVIQIYLDITPGIRPRGSGEGIDNKGGLYQVQF